LCIFLHKIFLCFVNATSTLLSTGFAKAGTKIITAVRILLYLTQTSNMNVSGIVYHSYFMFIPYKAETILGFFLSLLIITGGTAQIESEMPAPAYIKTVQFRGGTQFGQLPIVQLGQPLTITFDDIIGDEASYFYTIEHYNADWTPSILAKSEYLDGMDNIRIFEQENSVSTLQLYTHYRLSIPNRNTRALTKTGNYILKIFSSDQELIFSRKFMIYNPILAVGVEIKRSRDLKYVDSKQVVRFFVDGGETLLIDPRRNVKTVIIQNNDLKTAISDLVPQYNIGNKLEYRYDQESAFWGGNEFFNFDTKDVRNATAAISHVRLKSLYHHYLYSNITRSYEKYTFNPDINGNFTITTLQGDDTTIEAEYAWTHLSLDHIEVDVDQEIHVYGNFNNYTLDESTLMTFNPATQRYELPLLVKQGFYNYRYVVTDLDRNILAPNIIDGDFWQTENDYQVLVYYKAPGARFDALLGVGSANSSTITN